MSITIKELKEELQSQCVIMDRKFEMFEGKVDGLRNEVIEKFNTLENNHLKHIRDSQIDFDIRLAKFETYQKVAFSIGGILIAAIMGINSYLLKHLFTLLT